LDGKFKRWEKASRFCCKNCAILAGISAAALAPTLLLDSAELNNAPAERHQAGAHT
jgi:hypothetical protein